MSYKHYNNSAHDYLLIKTTIFLMLVISKVFYPMLPCPFNSWKRGRGSSAASLVASYNYAFA